MSELNDRVNPVVNVVTAAPAVQTSSNTGTYIFAFGTVFAMTFAGLAIAVNKKKEQKDYEERLLASYIDDETQ